MKKLLILITSASFLLLATPSFAADNNKSKSKFSGVKSSEHRSSSSRRGNSNRGQTNRGQTNRANSQRDRNAHSNRGQRSNRHVTQNRSSQHRRHGNRTRHTNNHRRGYANYNYYNGHRNRHHYRSRNNYNYLLGGVLLGSALSSHAHRHTAHCQHDYYFERPHHSRVVTTRVIREGTYASRDDRHYFRDRDGYCFEISYNRDGDEIREEIDSSYCEW